MSGELLRLDEVTVRLGGREILQGRLVHYPPR